MFDKDQIGSKTMASQVRETFVKEFDETMGKSLGFEELMNITEKNRFYEMVPKNGTRNLLNLASKWKRKEGLKSVANTMLTSRPKFWKCLLQVRVRPGSVKNRAWVRTWFTVGKRKPLVKSRTKPPQFT